MSRNKTLLALVALSSLAAGCELIVDFDRTKIPVEATDSGIVTIPDATADTGGGTDSASADTGTAADAAKGDADAGGLVDADAGDG